MEHYNFLYDMNKYKQPKTEWKSETWEDRQIIQKTVRWSPTEGIALLVEKSKGGIYPEIFIYVFAPNMADITKPVEIILAKNRRYLFGWKCELKEMDGIIGIMTHNEVGIEGTDGRVNLFDYHVKADTILIQYTTPDGREVVMKFPLAGFCENYLMQFTK